MKISEKELREALLCAKRIIDYSGGGDAWERECSQPDIDRFYEIINNVFPEEV